MSTPRIGACTAPSMHSKQFARPRRVGRAHGLRLADGGGHHPVARPQIRGKAAGDPKAHHAAVALPDGALGDFRKFIAPSPAQHHDAGAGCDLGFERHPDEGDHQATLGLGGNVGNRKRTVVGRNATRDAVGECRAKIHLKSHPKPSPPRLCSHPGQPAPKMSSGNDSGKSPKTKRKD